MILVLGALSCLVTSLLRLALASWSTLVPWCGVAWTVLFARRSRRGSFAAAALVLGLADGLVAPARWTAWPVAYLLLGALAFATRRFLPVRGPAGEAVMGALGALVVRIIGLPFPPFGLPLAPPPSGGLLVEALVTGLATGALAWLAGRWDPLRMALAKVA